MMGVFPLLLMSLALVKSGSETILGINGMVFGGIDHRRRICSLCGDKTAAAFGD